LLQVEVPLEWEPNVWFHLKTRVDVAGDGSGVIRAKAWKKGGPEPEAWTSQATRTRRRSLCRDVRGSRRRR